MVSNWKRSASRLHSKPGLNEFTLGTKEIEVVDSFTFLGPPSIGREDAPTTSENA